jgi:glycosyltransferase involved in cell wall biosynthesis
VIACFAKNGRAARLFKELRNIDGEFEDLGVVKASRGSKYLSAATSICWNLQQMRTDMQFSPIMAADMELRGSALLNAHPKPRAILYWGATNYPVQLRDRSIPYFLVTDGPFDPSDASYPIEWRPVRFPELYFKRQHRIYTEAAHVFTLSDWARNRLISTHGLDPGRVTRIGWGPMHFCAEPRFQLTVPNRFLSLGNRWNCKGMDIVSRATQLLRAKYREVVTIIAGDPCGSPIPFAPGLDVRPTQIPGDEAQRLISESRALIVASRFDASPHVIYEALQAGTPVIGSKVCGIPEAINAPHGGLVVPPEDPEALAEAMERVLTEDVRAQRKAAWAVFEQSGGWMQAAHTIYRRMLEAQIMQSV